MSYFRLMRAHRPVPILLIVWPTYWGLILNGQIPALKYFLIFGLGAILMRSAGCVINDYFDQKIDRFVARTKGRPLASGTRTACQALVLFFTLIVLSACLLLFLKPFTIYLSFIALFLALLYPLAKRVTHFPQFVLGLTFNFGLVMAYAEVNGHLSAQVWFWYAFAVIWTLIYDTEYAWVDRLDDLKIGVKSTAVFFGRHIFAFIAVLSVALIVMLGLDVLCLRLYAPLPILILICIAGFLLWHLYQLKQAGAEISFALFNQHHWLGLLVFGFLLHSASA